MLLSNILNIYVFSLPIQPGSLPNLQSLYCSYNTLGSLKEALEATSVPYMDFGHNYINSVSI